MTINERLKYIKDIAARYRATAERYEALAASVLDGSPLAKAPDFITALGQEVVARGIADMLPLPVTTGVPKARSAQEEFDEFNAPSPTTKSNPEVP